MDSPAAVRAGEALDTAPLEAWLRLQFPGEAGPLEVRQFPRGHSNLTYLVRLGPREMVLRRPPFGSKVKTAHDMGREYQVLSRLHAAYAPAPRALAYCADETMLGAPFYLMERVRGVILRRDPPAGLTVDPATARQLAESFVDNLAELHAVDYAGVGLAGLGKPQGYVQRQVHGWMERYRGSQTHDIPEAEKIGAWLVAHLPAESGAALIHNDYKYDNLVLDPQDITRILGVLDWEMCTLGDPLVDLGTALSYWVEAGDPDEMQQIRMGPTTLPGSLTRRELAERYAEKAGRHIAHPSFYYAFGLFKTAVIVQQIYYRYHHGFTRDERFASMHEAARTLLRAAVRAADSGM